MEPLAATIFSLWKHPQLLPADKEWLTIKMGYIFLKADASDPPVSSTLITELNQIYDYCLKTKHLKEFVRVPPKLSSSSSRSVRQYTGWNAPFFGDGVKVFHRHVEELGGEMQRNYGGDNYEARVLPIIQSTGGGKSKLLDEYSASHVGIVYAFHGTYNIVEYPPGDPEIGELLRDAVTNYDREVWKEFAVVIGLIGATASLSMTPRYPWICAELT